MTLGACDIVATFFMVLLGELDVEHRPGVVVIGEAFVSYGTFPRDPGECEGWALSWRATGPIPIAWLIIGGLGAIVSQEPIMLRLDLPVRTLLVMERQWKVARFAFDVVRSKDRPADPFLIFGRCDRGDWDGDLGGYGEAVGRRLGPLVFSSDEEAVGDFGGRPVRFRGCYQGTC